MVCISTTKSTMRTCKIVSIHTFFCTTLLAVFVMLVFVFIGIRVQMVYIHNPQLLQEVVEILCQRGEGCVPDYNKGCIYT